MRRAIMYKSKFRIFGAVMNAIAAVKQLYTRGLKTGTERTVAILNALQNPDKDLKIIHVAGTVRAATMCAVSIICKLFYQKSDRLNTLAFAATAILLITPLSLFSVGFQLSFCAVGGISVISKTNERLLKKIKTPQKIASGI